MNAPIDVTHIRIETERLILRPWLECDLEDFYEYARVDGVGQMAGWMPHQDRDESARILQMFIEEKKTLALELKENGKVVGSVGLETRDADLGIPEELMGREIGYVLNKDYWGKGLMPEAVQAIIDYCFRELRFDWLTCGHFVWNSQSRRVVEKCGFQYVRDVIHNTRFGTEELTKLYVQYNPMKMTAPMDLSGVRLETERLVLRPWNESDLADLHEYTSDLLVASGTGWKPSESLEETRERLERYMNIREGFAMELKENGKVIGDISVQGRHWSMYPIDRTLRGREFGYGIQSGYWGRGLVPEAVNVLKEYCFEQLGFDFITCGHFAGNLKSKRVIEKCGFTHLFDAPHTLPTGVTYDISTYILYNPNK